MQNKERASRENVAAASHRSGVATGEEEKGEGAQFDSNARGDSRTLLWMGRAWHKKTRITRFRTLPKK
jgi:hypothetical protein